VLTALSVPLLIFATERKTSARTCGILALLANAASLILYALVMQVGKRESGRFLQLAESFVPPENQALIRWAANLFHLELGWGAWSAVAAPGLAILTSFVLLMRKHLT